MSIFQKQFYGVFFFFYFLVYCAASQRLRQLWGFAVFLFLFPQFEKTSNLKNKHSDVYEIVIGFLCYFLTLNTPIV